MFRNIKLLSWLVVILLVTNMATIATVFYHTHRSGPEVANEEVEDHVPGDRRTRFFREQLQLTDDQLEPFREANRRFNRRARGLTMEMSGLRTDMLGELFSDSVSREYLAKIARQIGEDHEQLKMATCDFYLELKSICTDEQKEKLAAIFQSLLNADERVKLPGKQHRKGMQKEL
jgi:hypothetical protein